jgi:hypothetical protein
MLGHKWLNLHVVCFLLIIHLYTPTHVMRVDLRWFIWCHWRSYTCLYMLLTKIMAFLFIDKMSIYSGLEDNVIMVIKHAQLHVYEDRINQYLMQKANQTATSLGALCSLINFLMFCTLSTFTLSYICTDWWLGM